MELLLATVIGAVVLLGLYTAFAVATNTVQVVGQMERHNEAFRIAFDAALDEADFWYSYDDPRDRTLDGPTWSTDHWYSDDTQEMRDIRPPRTVGYGTDVELGLPFAPFERLRAGYNDDASGWASWQLSLNEFDLEPAGSSGSGVTARGLANRERVNELDRDRGWIGRPYQANDPRNWYRGNLTEYRVSWKPWGHYEMVANRAKELDVGLGADHLSIQRAWDNGDSTGPWTTGPYGTIANSNMTKVQTATWMPNQIVFLHDAIGSYGMLDYLAPNTILQVYGDTVLAARSADDSRYDDSSAVRLDGVMNGRLWGPYVKPNSGAPTPNDHSTDGLRLGDLVTSPGGYMEAVSGTTRHGASFEGALSLSPISRYSGKDFLGYRDSGDMGGFSTNQDLRGVFERDRDQGRWYIASHYRSQHANLRGHGFEMDRLLNRGSQIVPMGMHLPDGWSDAQVVVFRALIDGHFVDNMRLRVIDRATGEYGEVAFNALGTTFRGARQQRHPDGGWSAFVTADPARLGARLGLGAGKVNDIIAAQRTLDSAP